MKLRDYSQMHLMTIYLRAHFPTKGDINKLMLMNQTMITIQVKSIIKKKSRFKIAKKQRLSP